MGNYTGLSLRLKFKAGTPAFVIQVVTDLVKGVYLEDEKLTANEKQHHYARIRQLKLDFPWSILFDVSLVIYGGSAYFKHWDNVRTWEQQADGCWFLETKTSRKYPDLLNLKVFIEALLPYLVLEEGIVLHRSVGEESCRETVMYYSEGEVKEGAGWYSGPEDECTSTHPGRSGYDPSFEPPMIFADLQAAAKEKEAERLQRKMENSFGFM